MQPTNARPQPSTRTKPPHHQPRSRPSAERYEYLHIVTLPPLSPAERAEVIATRVDVLADYLVDGHLPGHALAAEHIAEQLRSLARSLV
jgi:hypothetical protein